MFWIGSQIVDRTTYVLGAKPGSPLEYTITITLLCASPLGLVRTGPRGSYPRALETGPVVQAHASYPRALEKGGRDCAPGFDHPTSFVARRRG